MENQMSFIEKVKEFIRFARSKLLSAIFNKTINAPPIAWINFEVENKTKSIENAIYALSKADYDLYYQYFALNVLIENGYLYYASNAETDVRNFQEFYIIVVSEPHPLTVVLSNTPKICSSFYDDIVSFAESSTLYMQLESNSVLGASTNLLDGTPWDRFAEVFTTSKLIDVDIVKEDFFTLILRIIKDEFVPNN
jgi:hypothetical protein